MPQKPALLKNLLRPVLPAVLMGGAVYGTSLLLMKLLGEDASSLILCGGPIIVGVVVYFVGVVLFKSIKKEDCQLLPKGDRIAKILHL